MNWDLHGGIDNSPMLATAFRDAFLQRKSRPSKCVEVSTNRPAVDAYFSGEFF